MCYVLVDSGGWAEKMLVVARRKKRKSNVTRRNYWLCRLFESNFPRTPKSAWTLPSSSGDDRRGTKTGNAVNDQFLVQSWLRSLQPNVCPASFRRLGKKWSSPDVECRWGTYLNRTCSQNDGNKSVVFLIHASGLFRFPFQYRRVTTFFPSPARRCHFFFFLISSSFFSSQDLTEGNFANPPLNFFVLW